MAILNPDINTVRGIELSMDKYGPLIDKSDRKVAISNIKKMMKKLLVASHQEQFIVLNNPNLIYDNWMAMINIADAVNVPINTIGIQLGKNEQEPNNHRKNKKHTNIPTFICTMHKYICVEDEHSFDIAMSTLEALIK
jgi:hypothetical protein